MVALNDELITQKAVVYPSQNVSSVMFLLYPSPLPWKDVRQKRRMFWKCSVLVLLIIAVTKVSGGIGAKLLKNVNAAPLPKKSTLHRKEVGKSARQYRTHRH